MLSKEDKEKVLQRAWKVAQKTKILSKIEKQKLSNLLNRLIESDSHLIELVIEDGVVESYLSDTISKLDRIAERNKNFDEGMEQYFKREKLEHELGRIEDRIWRLKLGQKDEARKLSAELKKFTDEVGKTDSAFLKRKDLEIDEMKGDITAILSDGEFGSSRIMARMERSGEVEAYQEKMKKKKK